MAIDQLTEEVAANLEEAAAVTRRLDARSIGFLLGGLALGAAVGFYFGKRHNRNKIREEIFAESEKELDAIREVYRQKMVAAEEKPSVEDVIEEKGYAVEEVEERPTRPPVPVQEPLTREDLKKDKDEDWDFEYELAQRSDDKPYIIHQDEFRNSDSGYRQVVYTYYAGDNVLTDEDEEKVEDIDDLVGRRNLGHFGHGSDDLRAVFVRNDRLNMEFEVCLVLASYEEEVQGLSNEQEPD